jgi:hypothetical protein
MERNPRIAERIDAVVRERVGDYAIKGDMVAEEVKQATEPPTG